MWVTNHLIAGAAVLAYVIVSGAGFAQGKDVDLKIRQAKIQALLVIDTDSGKGHAGFSSGLSITAFRENEGKRSEIKFNQDVGSMMDTALGEVVKHATFVHDGWPKGYRMELGFDEKYSGKDGPSAAVACALLLDSMLSGDELDQKFAVTGDMNADGSVQPIGGVGAKIRGATKGDCSVVAVPSKNEQGLSDLLLLAGPEPFVRIQVFAISEFKEAKAIARADRSGAEKSAIDTFATIQEVMLRDPKNIHSLLKNQKVQERLKQVYDEKPNHMSAKYLLLYGMGRAPEQLSVAGSFRSIEDGASLLIESLKSNSAEGSVSNLKPDELGGTINRLKNMRRKLDPRLRTYNDSLVDFGDLVRETQGLTLNSRKKVNDLINSLNRSIDNINNQREKLLKDPEIIEELEG